MVFKREREIFKKKKKGGWQSNWKYVTAFIKYHSGIYSMYQKDPTWPIYFSTAIHLTAENAEWQMHCQKNPKDFIIERHLNLMIAKWYFLRL